MSQVRIAHVDLYESDVDLEDAFARAVDRRCAWITGSGTTEELLTAARDAGYQLLVDDSDNAWVAVREDLIDSGWARTTELLQGTQTPSSYITVKVEDVSQS